MKRIKDFEVKYVLSPLEEKSVICGAAGCNCTVTGEHNVVANTLIVDGKEVPSHHFVKGDRCIEGLNNEPM